MNYKLKGKHCAVSSTQVKLYFIPKNSDKENRELGGKRGEAKEG